MVLGIDCDRGSNFFFVSLLRIAMPDNSRQPLLLADHPFDVIVKIPGECDVDGVLELSVVSTSSKYTASCS